MLFHRGRKWGFTQPLPDVFTVKISLVKKEHEKVIDNVPLVALTYTWPSGGHVPAKGALVGGALSS